MKRFWTDVSVVPAGDDWTIHLDGKAVRTPARAELKVPGAALADAIAEEWRAVSGDIDPRAMPLTGLANAAIDRVEPDPAAFADSLAAYAAGDLVCYRAEGPRELVAEQERGWDPLADWARRRFDCDFVTTSGITPVDQPRATVDRLAHEVRALDAFRLAGLSPLVTIGGSLVAALGVLDGGISAEAAWEAVSLDDRWQARKWGADDEAVAALENRRRDFLAAARFLELLDA